jgi:hypothetical protein
VLVAIEELGRAKAEWPRRSRQEQTGELLALVGDNVDRSLAQVMSFGFVRVPVVAP